MYRYSRTYTGPIKACILDWSGVTIDKYVIAPAIALVEVFKKHKVPITMEEARKPIGLRNDLHLSEITKIGDVAGRWKEEYGRYPNQNDIDKMYKDFVPKQIDFLEKYNDLIPGTAKAIDTLKTELRCKIGTTGYSRVIINVLINATVKQGYKPDAAVACDDVANGTKQKPHMIYKNMDVLDISPIQSVVKVDDTVSGIYEGLDAGCWSVGVYKYSNYMNVNSLDEELSLSHAELNQRQDISRDILVKSGAHYVIESIFGLPDVISEINERMARGEKP